ncbi:MAG: hypothetical protein U1F66_07795 [bacterium]
MSSPCEPNLLDVTVRDGSFQIFHTMTSELAARIARGLSEAGMKYAEVSHGCGIGSKLQGLPAKNDDEELMEAAKKAAPGLQLSAIVPPTDLATALLPALIDYLEIGRVIGSIQEPASVERIFQKLKKYEKKVFVQLVRAHRFSPEAVAGAAARFEAMGADVLYLVDSFGSMQPPDVLAYLQAIRANCKVEIGFHGHNHLGMAIPNTLAAWRAGASWLDASLIGVGRDGGNTQLEALVTILQAEGMLTEVRLGKLCETAEQAVIPVFEHAPASRQIDILLSEHRLDFSNKEYLILLANSLHVPLRDFMSLLAAKMGDEIQLSDTAIKSAVESLGQDFDQLVASFEKKAPQP